MIRMLIAALVSALVAAVISVSAQVAGYPPLNSFQIGQGAAPPSWKSLSQTQTVLQLGTMAFQNSNAVAITGGSVTGMPSPFNPSDVATKQYVDNSAVGFTAHAASRLATTAALPTNTYANGAAGVGATLTATANAALSVDGTAVVANDRVVVKNEATAANNGIYVVSQTGSGTVPYILTRAADANQPGTGNPLLIGYGSFSFITAGTANAGTGWIVNSVVLTIGTSAINFAQFFGGPQIDSTTIATTGDIKVRLSSETLSGWVILNGTTIGSATSGASQLFSGAAQNLFLYLWTNCTNAHCPVPGGRGATAMADWNANKQITLPDMRSKALVGRDCMGNASCAGLLLAGNITSGGGDGVDTPGAGGGLANQTASTTLAQTNLPNVNFAVTGSTTISAGQGSHTHPSNQPGVDAYVMQPGNGILASSGAGLGTAVATGGATLPSMSGTINAGAVAASGGSGTAAVSAAFSNMPPFLLATVYMRL